MIFEKHLKYEFVLLSATFQLHLGDSGDPEVLSSLGPWGFVKTQDYTDILKNNVKSVVSLLLGHLWVFWQRK